MNIFLKALSWSGEGLRQKNEIKLKNGTIVIIELIIKFQKNIQIQSRHGKVLIRYLINGKVVGNA